MLKPMSKDRKHVSKQIGFQVSGGWNPIADCRMQIADLWYRFALSS
ncbi:hypothetical protein D1AOALGA4SA_11788 [Olavius algarvensis Delta 1 endosymbiont]|nr:hypothetical protein D1AOALGA4SA_11788 [Olavius algarvensis Delta 1 endosymbiont]